MPEHKNQPLVYSCSHANDIPPYSRHFHMFYELIYVANGIVRLEVNGKKYIAERNSLIFISNLEEHSIEVLTHQYERYFIILSHLRLTQMIQDSVLLSLWKMRPQRFSHIIPAPNNTIEIMKHIIEENQIGDFYTEDIVAGYIKELLVKIYRKDREYFPISNKNIKPEILAIQKILDERFQENIRISDLANQYYISSCYLSHSFKDLTGYSPKQYLLLHRLSYARNQLIDSHDSVETVATKAGFTDATAFIRAFKSEYGITPKQYRKEYAL